jgi:hypothetical protein
MRKKTFAILGVVFLVAGCMKAPEAPGELSPGGPLPNVPPVKIDKNATLKNNNLNNVAKPKLKVDKKIIFQANL